MSHRRTSIAALAVGIGLLTAACTTSTDSTDATAVSSDMPTDATTTPARPASQQGPLDEFTARIMGTSADQTLQQLQDESDADLRWREEFIAACMAEQGFTYYPRLHTRPTVVISEGPARGTREFAERYGFGFAAGNMGGGEVSRTALISTGDDPNWSVINSMSDAEWEAWSYELTGEVLSGRTLPSGAFGTSSSCSGQAWESFQPQVMSEFMALSGEVSWFGHSIQTHPQMLALTSEWTACLAEKGYPLRLRDPIQLLESLNREWDQLRQADPINEGMRTWDWETEPDGPPGWWPRDDDLVRARVADPDAAAAWQATRDELAAREMALALADVDCRESLDFDARALVINHQLQQEFVDRNRDELEAWAAAAEAARDNR